jgi:hypothetical protein
MLVKGSDTDRELSKMLIWIWIQIVLGSRSREPNLNCLLEPEQNYELRLRLLSIYQRLGEVLLRKSWFLKKIFLNCYNFTLVRVKHASVHVKKVLVLKQKKVKFQRRLKNYSEPGPELEPESEPQFVFVSPRSRSRSRKKYFRFQKRY